MPAVRCSVADCNERERESISQPVDLLDIFAETRDSFSLPNSKVGSEGWRVEYTQPLSHSRERGSAPLGAKK